MKQLLLTTILITSLAIAFSQAPAIGLIESIKDESSNTGNYIGEIKNKQPNGLGILIYSTGNKLKYTGYFVNGKFEGKGVLYYTDGSFFSGDWKAGKLNGKGIQYAKNKDFYSGNFVDDKKSGPGTYIYADNSFTQGIFNNDQLNGRNIFIPKDGDVITDNIYVNNKKSGPGYQYETKDKKLYEGIWENGSWANAATGNYNSFLKNNELTSVKTADQISVGFTNADSYYIDTTFFYDLKNKARYFGLYDNGFLKNGLLIRDDTSRFIGSFNKLGANGKGVYVKLDKFYDEGNYVNDYLNGDKCLSIDLDKKTVFYGGMTGKGVFSGQSWYASSTNDLYNGKYIDGSFVEGWRIDKTGYFVKGTWDKGYINKISAFYNELGEQINPTPKTFSEALSTIAKAYPSYYYGIQSKDGYSENYDAMEIFYESMIHFPGAMAPDLIGSDYDYYNYHLSTYVETDDYSNAKVKYDDLCKQIKAATITLKKGATPLKLTGTAEPANESQKFTISQFNLPDNTTGFSEFTVAVILQETNKAKNKYVVTIACGDKTGISAWDTK